MATQGLLYKVMYVDGGWTVIDRGGTRFSGPLEVQGEAVVLAKDLAVRAGSAQIVVYSREGKIVSDFFHQRDERPILSQDETASNSMRFSHPATRTSRPSAPSQS